MREKVGKSPNTVFFPMIWGSGGSKSRLAKAAGAEPAGEMRDEKVHAVVARSTFRSQNVQNTSSVGRLLEVEMLVKCTPLWREAHFQVKIYKTLHVRATFGGSDVKCTPLWREAHFEVKMLKTPGFGPLLEVQMTLRFTKLHYTTLHFTTLRSTTLHYITLHCTTFHYTSLHYTTLHYTTTTTTTTTATATTTTQLHSTTIHSTTLHYPTLHYTPLHYTTLPSTTLHYITLHYTPLH